MIINCQRTNCLWYEPDGCCRRGVVKISNQCVCQTYRDATEEERKERRELYSDDSVVEQKEEITI